MTDTGRYSFFVRASAWVAPAALILGGGLLWHALAEWPGAAPYRPAPMPRAPVPPRVTVPLGLNWTVFKGVGEPTGGRRLRLAGTFFVSDGGGLDIRKAVLDLVRTGEQRIVVAGDQVEDAVVTRISRDRIVLRAGAGEETLWLSFSSASGKGVAAAADDSAGVAPGVPGRFGQQVAENNWVFQREALMAYYNELWDQPERMLQVFDSLKPLYDENRRITGYKVGIEGERDFFDAVGFREDDVVRKVNSVAMTNRGRAENFIEQFAKNRMNIFVVDIERDGKAQRLVYRIR